MFLQMLETDPLYYFTVVFVVVVSIVLHELGHAYAAIWEGDPTPEEHGHLTANPMVHMGPMALIMLAVFGIAWGLTPVNPRNFRHGRKGEALVSFAGPAVNLVLLVVGAVGWTLASLAWGANPEPGQSNVLLLLRMLAVMNGVLFLLNMLPIPPLDGFTVLSSLSGAFRRVSAQVERYAMILFLAVFFLGAPYLFEGARWLTDGIASVVAAVAG